MYFKINKGTETYKKISALSDKIEMCRARARKLVKQLGGKKKFSHGLHTLAGGISGIEFDEKPEGWKQVGEPYQHLYYPKVVSSMSAVHRKIEDLPTVDHDELNEIVGFDGPQTVAADRGLAWVSTVGMVFGKQFHLMEVAKGCKYKPGKDIIEILESEYDRLEKEVESKKKK